MDGNSLKEARLKKSWTQEQAALALDVTQAYLSMLETGRRPVCRTDLCVGLSRC
jgi:transcriptional regulator with XRE-family HTH domain